ncbi:MAG: tetratricopeptide repeat protein [Bacteroidota bacterium]
MGKYICLFTLLAISQVCFPQAEKNQDHHSSDTYTLEGARAITNRNYLKAVESLSKAIAIHPDHKLAYQFRGEAYVRLKSYPKALEDFTAAIKLDAKDPQLFVKRGRIFEYMGQPGHARADYLECLLLAPDFSEAKTLLAAMDEMSTPPSYRLVQQEDIWEQQLTEVKGSIVEKSHTARPVMSYRTRVIRRNQGILYARVAANLTNDETEIKLLANQAIGAFHEDIHSYVKLKGSKTYQQSYGSRKIEHRFNAHTQLHEYRLLGFPTLESNEDRLTLEVITPQSHLNWSIDIAILGIGGPSIRQGR